MYRTTVQIDGMMCSMCESHVNDAIRNTLQIRKVSSSHKKNTAEIISEEPVSEAELHRALDDTGYRIISVTSEEYRKKGLFSR